MLDHTNSLPQSWPRNASRAALKLIVASLILLSGNVISAQWDRQQVSPQLLVEFRLTLTPDKEAESAGAVAFSNLVGMSGGIWKDQFTGFGDVPDSFEPSNIYLRTLSEGYYHPFEVSLRSRSKNDLVSRIEWKGKLEGGKISGDVWITMPGMPLMPEEIRAKRSDRNQVKRNATVVQIDGTVLNEKVAEHAGREADRKNALLATQGRRLHFTFSTAEIVIIPIGSWSSEMPPATQPSATEIRR